MILTEKQLKGLEIAVERYNNGEGWTTISGYAGSGKSTLIKFIIAALNVDSYEVAYVAYTGKAANVLQAKGCPNATTAHKLLYRAKPMPDGSFQFEPKSLVDSGYKVIVVDEVSMLPIEMWNLLISHGIYVIAAGDPGQLPPVDKNSNNHVLDNPHIFLDEIMRQAQDSEIIRFSMWLREGRSPRDFPCANQQVKILNSQDLVSGMFVWPDQILCSTNAKRIEINRYVRKLMGHSELPQVGDKIICLRNHWEISSYEGNWALTNGLIGTLENIRVKNVRYPSYISDKVHRCMYADIRLEDGDCFYNIPIDYDYLLTGNPTFTPQQQYKISRMKKNPYFGPPLLEFDYSYAITCHKSQGSSWPKVLVFEEKFPFNKQEHIQSLYTAVTRAEDKAVIIINN